MTTFTRFLDLLNPSAQKQDNTEVAKPTVETETPTENLIVETSKLELVSSKIKSIFGFRPSNDMTIEEHQEKIKSMTKLELDQYAEKYDIYLDRRKTKANMINEFIEKLKEKM
jgi:hypothetical protein